MNLASFNVLDKDYVEAKQKELESGVSVEEVFVDVNQEDGEDGEEEETIESVVTPVLKYICYSI